MSRTVGPQLLLLFSHAASTRSLLPHPQDILIQGEGGAQILVEPELVEHFEAALTQVRSVPVVTRVISLRDLRVAPPKKQSISSIEASLRLDAVASAGDNKLAASECELVAALCSISCQTP